MPEPESGAETASELPFGADQPGFTDWRVELRERLKKIRARRESEQQEAEAAASGSTADGDDESDVPTLDDVDLQAGEADDTQELDVPPELEQTLEQPAEAGDLDEEPIATAEAATEEDNVIELAEVLGGPDLPIQEDVASEAEGEPEEIVAAVSDAEMEEEPAGAQDDAGAAVIADAIDEEVVVDEGLEEGAVDDEATEIAPPGEPTAEGLDELIADTAESGATAPTDAVAGAAAGAAAGKAASGWDSDVIADLQTGSAESAEVDLDDDSGELLAATELEGEQVAAEEADPEVEAVLADESAAAEDEAHVDAEGEEAVEEGIAEDVPQAETIDVVTPVEDAEAEELVAEGLTEDAVPAVDDEPVTHEEVALDAEAGELPAAEEIADVSPVDEIEVDLDEAPMAEVESEPGELALEDLVGDEISDAPEQAQELNVDEVAPAVAAEDFGTPGEQEAGAADAAALEFDEAGTPQAEQAPDLVLDIDEIPSSQTDGGLEWDTPESPELMRPATSGLDRSAAPLGQRVIAGIADALVLVIIAGILVGTASSASGAAYDVLLADAIVPLALAWAIFAAGYLVFFTGTCGQTIGKMIMKLRVVSTDQLSVGFGRATRRLIASVPSILVLGIGFFLAARDPKRRTVYDRVAQTRVIRA
jgi:uncharacterized RDD family membrane protein YckC